MQSRLSVVGMVLIFAAALHAEPNGPDAGESTLKPDAAEVRSYVDGVKLSYKVIVLTPARSGRAAKPLSDVDKIADHISFERAMKSAANSEQRKMLVRFREKFRDCGNAAAPSLSELDDSYIERLERCGEGISDSAADVIAAGY